MKSIVNVQKNSDISTTLNFVFVNHGDIDGVKSSVLYLQNELEKMITSNGGVVFDSDWVEQAEANPKYLGRKHKFVLKTSKSSVEQKYIGYFEKDIEKLHKILFSSNFDTESFFRDLSIGELNDLAKVLKGEQKDVFFFSHSDSKPNNTQYSKEALVSALQCGPKDLPYNEFLFDFTIEHKYFEDKNIALSNVTLSINKVCIEDISETLELYNQTVKYMDMNFSEVFRSAYISYGNPDYPILHTALYGWYDEDNLSQYILGTEWSVYLSENIAKRLNDKDLTNLSEITSIFNLQHGLQYVSKADIINFDNECHTKLSMILEKIIIPAFSDFSWKTLLCDGVPAIPKNVLVFENEIFHDNPLVVFLYNKDINAVFDEDSLKTMKLIDTLQFDKYN